MNLKSLFLRATLVGCALFAAATYAAAPTGSTGECKDGTYSSAASKRGACAGHGGVKDWYAADKAESATKASTAPAAVAPAAAGAPSKVTEKSTGTPTTAAAGGGPGQVWVNTSSKVYHCPGDKWYGKTKKGQYMSESAAKTAGNRADHGKACG